MYKKKFVGKKNQQGMPLADDRKLLQGVEVSESHNICWP